MNDKIPTETSNAAGTLINNLIDSNEFLLEEFVNTKSLEKILRKLNKDEVKDENMKMEYMRLIINVLSTEEMRDYFHTSVECQEELVKLLELNKNKLKMKNLIFEIFLNISLSPNYIFDLFINKIPLFYEIKKIMEDKKKKMLIKSGGAAMDPLEDDLFKISLKILINSTTQIDLQNYLIYFMLPDEDKRNFSLLFFLDYFLTTDDIVIHTCLIKLIANFSIKGRHRKYFNEDESGKLLILKINQLLNKLTNQKARSEEEETLLEAIHIALGNLAFPYESSYPDENLFAPPPAPSDTFYFPPIQFYDDPDEESERELSLFPVIPSPPSSPPPLSPAGLFSFLLLSSPPL